MAETREAPMPRRTALGTKLHAVLTQFAAELTNVLEAELTDRARNGHARERAAKKNGHARARGRRGGVDEKTLALLLKTIKANPGLRSEQVYAKLSIPVEEARRALEKLRRDDRVKTKGQKRSTKYTAR